MNTHIIIPIKDIQKAMKAGSDATVNNLYNLINNAKQISLDEKDIEKKAKDYVYDEWGEEDWQREQSYSQALKELL